MTYAEPNDDVTAKIWADPYISSVYKNNNETKQQQIEKAVEQLRETDYPVEASRKAVEILDRGKIKVFFSYKFKEENVARAIVEILRAQSTGVEITYAAEFRETIVGEEYAKRIDNEIKEADWLMLLLPDPTEDWDWCLFEAGIFKGQRVSSELEKLICLHHPGQEPPDMISQFQSVPATEQNVTGLLTQIYLNEEPIPGMERLRPPEAKSTLSEQAKKIVNIITPPLKRRHYDSYVIVRPKGPVELQEPSDMNEWAIEEIDELAVRNIFAKSTTPNTWKELVSNVVAGESAPMWLEQLAKAVSQAGKGDAFPPVQATLLGANSGKVYKPILHAADADLEERFLRFQILFVEEVGGVQISKVPSDIFTLATSLRLALRFKWEVLDKYNRKSLRRNDLPKVRETLNRINAEAASRGLLDQQKLLSLFERPHRQTVEEMFAYWNQLYRDDEQGELNKALADPGHVKKTLGIFANLARMNEEFLKVASKRFHELMDV